MGDIRISQILWRISIFGKVTADIIIFG